METYAYLPFEQRIQASYSFLRESLLYVAEHGREIVELLDSCVEPPTQIAVRYRLEAFEDRVAEILTRDPYCLTGDPVNVKVPHFARFVGEHPVKRPLAYAVPADIARHLSSHGLKLAEFDGPVSVHAEIARANRIRRAADTRGRHIGPPGRRVLDRKSRPAAQLACGIHRSTTRRHRGISVRGGQ